MKTLYLIGIFIIVVILTRGPLEEQEAEKKQQDVTYSVPFKATLIKNLGGPKKHWAKYSFEYKDNSYDFDITYKEFYDDFEKIQNETKLIGRKILQQIIKEGRNPSEIFINVSITQEAGKGETGQKLYRYFG